MNLRLSAVLATAAVVLAAPAHAAFPNDCSVTDVIVNATACAGVYTSNNGNNLGDGNTTVADLTAAFGDFDWSLSVARLSADEAEVGTIDLPGTISGPFAIAIKAGSAQSGGGYSLYYFDATKTGISSLDFISTPAGKELSHASLYVGVVPEPETYAMMLAGLAAVGFMARRRRS